MLHHKLFKLFLVIFTLGSTLILPAQNYRDQVILIRLRPDYSLVIGKISDYTGEKLSNATISLFDPNSYQATETIPVDDSGDYLFTLKKGATYGFLVEKEGYFPYYHILHLPEDAQDQMEYPLHLPDGIRKQYTLVFSENGSIPVNGSILEELISLLLNQTALSLWIPDQENPIGKSRISFLDSLLPSRGVEKYRLISGSLPGNTDQIIELSFETDPEAENIPSYNPVSPGEKSDDKWTLQFSASKSKLPERDLRGLKDYEVYEGNDGFYRYTYGVFNTRQEANASIPYLRNLGFNQAFPKRIGIIKSL